MKKSLLTLAIALAGYAVNAQVYTSPANNVGIGTETPIGKLEVNDNYSSGVIAYFGAYRINEAKGIYFSRPVAKTNPVNIQGSQSSIGAVDISLQAEGGNVGIGTSQPIGKLDVTDDNGTGKIAYFGSYYRNDAKGMYFSRPVVNTNPINIQGSQSSIGAVDISLQAEGGNVGIGTSQPIGKLEVNAGSGTGIIAYFGAYRLNEVKGLYLSRPVVSTNPVNIQGSQSSVGAVDISLQAEGGNVGIRTSNPNGYKLAVNGSIHAKEVKIDLDEFPDYVFKPDYNLRPLTEVKTFIDQNHHLPEMPSEKEVIKDGVNVGELNKLLVKKVEELTLYLIEKDKQLKEQEAKIERQEKRLDKFEALLKKK
ncbi:hypothetical protein [Pedobacter lusitanus]|uniref:hypothetical protein n=1 Tax=Pedobacter lusitanus TaxID=1503925 RepID=UPI0006970DB2|nr:hypothetical protein [Pedobacter lusitanus]